MSTENTNIDAPTETTLDDFAADLFGGSKAEPSDDATSEVEEVDELEDDATNEDTHSADNGATEDDESEEEPTDDGDDKAKPKNRYQERINELTAKARQAERERDELRKKLEESTTPKEPEPKPSPKTTVTNTGAPAPTDTNEDGSDKYPLGEFDPNFLRDTVQFMLDQKEAEQKEQQRKYQEEQEILRQRDAVQQVWDEKLVDAQERYPDYQEKGQALIDSFAGIDESYGQYLTDTIMELDAGPDVFYYLATNPEEAKKIVDAGPRKATIALAKLEEKFVSANSETKAVRTKTTKAPPPPPQLKGSSVARASVDVNTDDLDAFTKALFKTK